MEQKQWAASTSKEGHCSLQWCGRNTFSKPSLLGCALKPTDVDPLWVCVTCVWFRPEVSFASDE
ncbi:hypothetical protein TSUD_177130 [Trifolium subterraneum]|uniref:Uncharacterized protein n=1 Tax=Trifolium subterraneum TaxID=3900 RepID=A0A2Z6NTZ0_TRISU|nr:hypothetical protein TSUD_177130 [Trifolium subterraneum]